MTAYCIDCIFKNQKSELPLRKPDQPAVPHPPGQPVLFLRLRCSCYRDGDRNRMRCAITIVGAIFHVPRTPFVLMRVTPRGRALSMSPPSDAESPRLESMTKSCDVLSSVMWHSVAGATLDARSPEAHGAKHGLASELRTVTRGDGLSEPTWTTLGEALK